MRRLSIIACIVACGFAATAMGEPAATTSPATTGPSVYRGEGFAIALPAGWGDDPDARKGLAKIVLTATDPRKLADEHGAPLETEIQVERTEFAAGFLGYCVKRALDDARYSQPRLKLIGEPTTRPIKLADGTPAVMLVAEFNEQPQRHSLWIKVFAEGGRDKAVWVVSGSISGSGRSAIPSLRGEAAPWLASHVTSFAFDPSKVDASRMPPMPAFAEFAPPPPPSRPGKGKKRLP